MTKDDAITIAEVISGYDQWRRQKVAELESSGYQLSASHYLDELAKQRAIDTVEELIELFSGPYVDDLLYRTRQILGIK